MIDRESMFRAGVEIPNKVNQIALPTWILISLLLLFLRQNGGGPRGAASSLYFRAVQP